MKAAILPGLLLFLGLLFGSQERASGAVVISDVANRVISEDSTTGPIQFSITGFQSRQPEVTASSDDDRLVPSKGIVIGGTGGARTITVTPAANQSGSATITISVTDPGGNDTETFILTVRAINDPPTITDIANASIDEDKVFGPASFTIGDVDDAVTSLSVTTSSTNEKLVPLSAIRVDGTGANRTITVTPSAHQSGSTTIGIFVSDGALSASTRFTLTVNAVNDPPAFSPIADVTIDEDTDTGARTYSVTDVENGSANISVTARSSNPALVPDSNITLGTAAATALVRTVKVVPVANASGEALITLTASDGTASSEESFLVKVNPVNDGPTLGGIPDQKIDEDKSTGPISFTVGDIDTPLDKLILTATSTDASIVPDGNIVFGGSGSSRTVTVTPLANRFGNVTISVSLSDGAAGTGGRFSVSVAPVNDPPAITPVADQIIDQDGATGSLPFGVTDIDSSSTALTVRATSSNVDLVSANGIALGGGGSERTVKVTPLPKQTGVTTITLIASDGSATSEEPFTVTVRGVNTPPTITDIPNQSINEDGNTGALAFTVGDAQTAAANLTVTVSSSNTALVPNGNVTLGGSGANRTVTVTPLGNQSGSTTVTVTVSDGVATANDAFVVEVKPVNDSPTISDISNQSINEDGNTGALPFTVGDAETAAANLTVTTSSSNPALVPNGNVVLGGAGANRTVTVTPLGNQTGSTTVTVTVSDGVATASDTFTVEVKPVNDLPTISDIPNQSINEDGNTGALAFTVGDAETAAANLTVTASSSNTALVPNGNVTIGGSGANRTVTVTPLGNQTGTTTITVTVSDGVATANDIFSVEVKPLNDPPTISDIPNQQVQAGNGTGAIAFTIGDPDGSLDSLRVTAASSDTSRVPLTAIVFAGTGANRTVSITPSGTQSGTVTITVTVTDGVASAADSFLLTISATAEAPKIASSPQNTSADEGSTVTLRVVATGTAPFRYQWQLDGKDLPDGTEQDYIIRNFQASQAGNYTVRVSNSAGSVTSAAASLSVLRLDYGDTPDGSLAPAYPTLLSRDGARHVIVTGFHLGSSVDSETDARISASATGDDTGGSVPDDEDGVEFVTQPLVPGQTAQVRVVLPASAGNGGRLDAFIDFNRDGVWSLPAERIFGGQPLVPGVNSLSFQVPSDVKEMETFARFRLSREGGLSPTGRAADGEVEDYLIRIGPAQPSEKLDFGDAPESSIAVLYRTRAASNGPRHLVVPGFFLGRLVDAEADGQPNSDATGDDLAGGNLDDEDGVQFASGFEPGKAATLIVTASSGGTLDAWFDFNRASGFESGEHAINRFPLVAGPNTIVVQVPANAVAGDTFARFRLSPNGIETPDHPSPTAPIMEGEVEDYRITITETKEALDFGDAPDAAAGTVGFGYPTLLARNGARHVIVQGIHLGKTVDGETDGQPTGTATGDDMNPQNLDDEDGVEFQGPILAGTTAKLVVTASQTGRLDAWMDFNGNRSWADPGEQIFASTILAGGPNTLTFAVPQSAKDGQTFARFRFSRDGKLGFVGQARDGEVEDYQVTIESGAPCDVNYKGTEFWLAFPGNYPQGPDTPLRLTLCIVGPAGITGTVSVPGSRFSKDFALPASMVAEVLLPDSTSLGENVDVVQNRGIHVESSGPVAVFGLNRIPYSSDGYLGLPAGALGTEYIVAGYANVFSSVSALNGTQFAVVATEDDTVVTITPSRDVLGHPKGEPFDVPLKQGQAYQLRDPEDATADLSGTEIHSNKPISVFGGHQCANIDSPSKMFCDHLVEQLLPVSAWGKIFYAVPFATRSGGDTLRILGSKDNTQIFINGSASGTIRRGQVRTFDLAGVTRIDASRPVFVSQLARSSDHDDVENADPFMVTVPPLRFYTRDHMICTGPAQLAIHRVNIVIPTSAIGSLTLDGAPVPAGSFSAIGASGFSSARISVPAGPHALSANQPFGTVVYGFGPYEGYGWPGGMYFGDIHPPTIVCPPDFTVNAGTVIGTAAGLKCAASVPDLRQKVTVSDNCELPTQRVVTQDPAPNTVVGIGEHVITLTATDAAGNESECQVTMTVVDAGPASIICPKDFTVVCNKGAGATVAYQVVARTECGTTLTVECTPPSGSMLYPGTTTVQCRIKEFPNQTCSFKVTVVCPEDVTNIRANRTPALAWNGDGVLETAFALKGPWTPVPAATSPFAPAAIGEFQFFRIRPSASSPALQSRSVRPELRIHWATPQ